MHERHIRTDPTIREERRLGFYAALFDAPAVVYDFRPGEKQRSDYTEVIRPGAFTDALSGAGEVIANVNHDPGRTFAKRSDGSLLLQEDPVGLYVSCWLPDDPLGNSVLEDVKAGKLDAASFQFTPKNNRWTGDECELLAVNLFDVCLTARPAYPQTKGEVHLRTADRLRELFARLMLVKLLTK
jgi:HK97 family phage prohead protease